MSSVSRRDRTQPIASCARADGLTTAPLRVGNPTDPGRLWLGDARCHPQPSLWLLADLADSPPSRVSTYGAPGDPGRRSGSRAPAASGPGAGRSRCAKNSARVRSRVRNSPRTGGRGHDRARPAHAAHHRAEVGRLDDPDALRAQPLLEEVARPAGARRSWSLQPARRTSRRSAGSSRGRSPGPARDVRRRTPSEEAAAGGARRARRTGCP